MKLKYLAGILVLAATPFAVQAAPQAANFGYSHVEGGFADFDVQDGLFIGGSFGFTPNIHAVATFYSLDVTDITIVGAGYHTGIANNLDAYGEVKFVDVDTDDGLGLTGGVRFAVAPQFEIGGGLNYYNFDAGSETNLFVNGAFTFQKNLAIIAEFESGDILDKFQVGVRYDF